MYPTGDSYGGFPFPVKIGVDDVAVNAHALLKRAKLAGGGGLSYTGSILARG